MSSDQPKNSSNSGCIAIWNKGIFYLKKYFQILCCQIKKDSCSRFFTIAFFGFLGAYIFSIYDEQINHSIVKFSWKTGLLGAFSSIVAIYILLDKKDYSVKVFAFSLLFGFGYKIILESSNTYLKSQIGKRDFNKERAALKVIEKRSKTSMDDKQTISQINRVLRKIPTFSENNQKLELQDGIERVFKNLSHQISSRGKITKEKAKAIGGLLKTAKFSNQKGIENFMIHTAATSILIESPSEFSKILVDKDGYYPLGSRTDATFNREYKEKMIKYLNEKRDYAFILAKNIPQERIRQYEKSVRTNIGDAKSEEEKKALKNLLEALRSMNKKRRKK